MNEVEIARRRFRGWSRWFILPSPQIVLLGQMQVLFFGTLFWVSGECYKLVSPPPPKKKFDNINHRFRKKHT